MSVRRQLCTPVRDAVADCRRTSSSISSPAPGPSCPSRWSTSTDNPVPTDDRCRRSSSLRSDLSSSDGDSDSGSESADTEVDVENRSDVSDTESVIILDSKNDADLLFDYR